MEEDLEEEQEYRSNSIQIGNWCLPLRHSERDGIDKVDVAWRRQLRSTTHDKELDYVESKGREEERLSQNQRHPEK